MAQRLGTPALIHPIQVTRIRVFGRINTSRLRMLSMCLVHRVCKCVCSVVSDSSVTPWTVGSEGAHQAPLSMEFSRQEYWSGLPCPPLGDLPDLGIEPKSPASRTLAGGCFTTMPPGKPCSQWNPTPLTRKTQGVIFFFQVRSLSWFMVTAHQAGCNSGFLVRKIP